MLSDGEAEGSRKATTRQSELGTADVYAASRYDGVRKSVASVGIDKGYVRGIDETTRMVRAKQESVLYPGVVAQSLANSIGSKLMSLLSPGTTANGCLNSR
jgi:hypothetical protein